MTGEECLKTNRHFLFSITKVLYVSKCVAAGKKIIYSYCQIGGMNKQ